MKQLTPSDARELEKQPILNYEAAEPFLSRRDKVDLFIIAFILLTVFGGIALLFLGLAISGAA